MHGIALSQRFGRAAWGLRLASLAAILIAVCSPLSAAALGIPPKPTDLPVVDQTGTLSQEQRQALAGKIAAERAQSGNEIAVLMVRSLEGEALEDYSLKVARAWGIGQKERDSGVLLLVAKDDRRLRIEVGYGLEGALPDIRANQIIEQRITPQFREGKYYEGIDSGVDGIITAIKGERDPALQTGQGSGQSGGGISFELIAWGVILVPVWLSSILGRTKSWWAGGAIGAAAGIAVGIFFGFLFFGVAAIAILTILGLLFDKKVSENYRQAASSQHDTPSWWAGGPWLGGGGRGGSSGGGFGGFSGGSFGGGGSSGSW